MTPWGRSLAQHARPLRVDCVTRQCSRPIAACSGARPTHGADHSGGAHSSSGSKARVRGSLAVGLGLAAAAPALRATRCDEHSDDDAVGRLYPKDLEKLLTPSESNPVPVTVPPPMPGLASQHWQRPHVAPIFGLPFRGKGHAARQLKRYIEFFHGARAEIFYLDEYLTPDGDDLLFQDLEGFFGLSKESPAYDASADKARQTTGGFAIIVSSDLSESTTSMWSPHTKWHRRWIANVLQERLKAYLCYVQISVTAAIGDKYVEDLARVRGMPMEQCKEIISAYQDHFVPIQMDGSESDTPFINIINYNERFVANRMLQTFVGSEVCHFLANLHPYEHTIHVSLHAETEFNVQHRKGGDASLSSRGREYARRLAEFSHFVIAGQATNLVCVTVPQEDSKAMHARLCQRDGVPGIYTNGNWEGFGDASGAAVSSGMRLVRFQPGFGTNFVDAPGTIDEVVWALGSAKQGTLVFIDGEAEGAGQKPCRLWTSSLKRTIETTQFIERTIVKSNSGKPWFQFRGQKFRNLDEVYAGEFDGLTEEEIRNIDPNLASDIEKDKTGFRYPRGESINDVVARVQNSMNRLERVKEPILLVGHQVVSRLVHGWLTQKDRDVALEVALPRHVVIRICYDGLGGPRVETRFPLGPSATSFR